MGGPIRWTPRLAVAAMLGAVLIYGLNFVVVRFATRNGLTPADLTALRFAVAAPLLLPVFLARGAAGCAGIGWPRGLALAFAGGVPAALLTNTGLTLAPAAHGAALTPGTVTVVGTVLGAFLVRRLPSRLALAGLALVLAGLASIALGGAGGSGPSVALGDLCFVLTGLLWGLYPILLGRWRVDALTGAAVAAVLSLPYVAVYVASGARGLLDAPLGLVLFQAAYQGAVSGVLALWLWGSAVRTLGAPRTLLYPPLVPVVGTLAAVPVLNEWPSATGLAGVAVIVVGLVLSAVASSRAARAAAAREGLAETAP